MTAVLNAKNLSSPETTATPLAAEPLPIGKLDNHTSSYIEITIASFIWGFSYVATKWALVGWDPLVLSCLRFLIPGMMAFAYMLSHPKLRSKFNLMDIKLAMIPGSLLGINVICWTVGLKFTSVASSGFIFTLYIVLVPLISALILKTTFSMKQMAYISLAFFGTFFVSGFHIENSFNKGDILTFCCALAAAVHIVMVERVIKRVQSPFTFNIGQTLFAGGLALFAQFYSAEKFEIPAFDMKVWGGFFILAIGTTLISNLLQVRAQRHLPSAVVGLFTLLESPFASLFAFIFIGELFTMSQGFGAALIIAAAIFTTRSQKSA